MKYSFEIINNVLNSVFLDGRFQGVPVYLDMEGEIVDEVAKKLKCKSSELDLIIGHTVANSLTWQGNNIYYYHLENEKQWRTDKNKFTSPPPFTALLLALSIAAERMRKDEDYSANNYYYRLCEVFNITDQQLYGKLSQNGKHTKIFWLSLNLWLVQNNYNYGMPTAVSSHRSWIYVGYALSQSLIRDADRQKFHDLFLKYNLSPYDSLGESEMNLYLHEWMAGPGPSPWLKKIWGKTDLRERVILSAIHELELWEHSKETIVNRATRRLFWTVSVQLFPKKQIDLFLSTSSRQDSQSTALKLHRDSKQSTRKAFNSCKNIWLTPLTGSEFECIEPIEKLKLDLMLISPFELISENTGQSYRHEPRPIIPFIKLETSRYFKQVENLSLYFDHVILCHLNWKDNVKKYLDSYARPGFTVIDSSSDNGLPKDWVLINCVQLIKSPQEQIPDNLQCLVPFDAGALIRLNGGLKLSPHIWHTKLPPEVFASDDDGMLGLALQSTEISSAEKILFEQNSSNLKPDFLIKLDTQLDMQNFTLSAIRLKKNIAHKSISFRSASTPRKLISDKDKIISYSLGATCRHTLNFKAINTTEEQSDSAILQGMILDGDLTVFEEPDIDKSTSFPLDLHYTEEEFRRGYESTNLGTFPKSCVVRGHHHWICEPYDGPGHTKNSWKMECRDCHMTAFAKKPKKRRKTKSSRNKANTLINIPPVSEHKISAEIFYDAVCYLGAGTWNKLKALSGSLEGPPWHIVELARNLFDLGHIDILFNDNNKPAYWSCNPPTVVITENNNAFLSGFINDEMKENLGKYLTNLSVKLHSKSQELAPSAIIFNINKVNPENLIDLLSHPQGTTLSIVRSPAKAIISALPSIKSIKNSLPEIHIEDRDDIEKFDPRTGRWRKSPLTGKGAYRTFFAGRRYFYHDNQSNSYESDYEIVKILAAKDLGIRLHGFNKNYSSFECVIGCEPPGICRRALVSCSGMLPDLKDGKICYRDVPEDIAKILLYKLYS